MEPYTKSNTNRGHILIRTYGDADPLGSNLGLRNGLMHILEWMKNTGKEYSSAVKSTCLKQVLTIITQEG